MIQILFHIGFGIILFFYGLSLMRTGLERLAGEKLEQWLLRFTKKPWIGFVTGTIATALVQSSTAITVITVGLVNAQVLTFRQSIGIILGSNVGTTVTTQLIALSLEDFTLPLILIGFILWLIPKKTIRFAGLAIGGFSLMILAISIMGNVAAPIASSPTFQSWLTTMSEHYSLSMLIGTLFTALIHSSSATTAITMVFVEGGLIPLSSAVAVILGSNLGTCISAFMASIGGNIGGKLVAYAHIFLNLFGVLAFLPLVDVLTQVVTLLADDPSVQVAHAQTIFNVVSSLLVLPFSYQFGRFVEWITRSRVGHSVL